MIRLGSRLYPQGIKSEIRFDITTLWCQIKRLMNASNIADSSINQIFILHNPEDNAKFATIWEELCWNLLESE